MTKTIAVIDADIVAYRCAAAAETRSIKAVHITTGQEIKCAHRTSLKEQIKDTFEIGEFEIIDVQTPEDIANAIHAMNTCVDAFKKSCKADKVELYISGKDNFRDSLPLPSKYKGNRTGLRPLHLAKCRDYLIKNGAEVINGSEVDDMLAQRCYEGMKSRDKVIAVTNDGDQNGVEGWMYNWTKQFEPKLIKGLGEIHLTENRKDFDGYGRKFFYAQWVYGDWNVDRFKPAELSKKSFGVVALHKLLENCKTDRECVEAVYKQFKSWYPAEVVYNDWTGKQHTTDAIGLMDLYAACAHMLRFDGDVFDTRALLTKLQIEHD